MCVLKKKKMSKSMMCQRKKTYGGRQSEYNLDMFQQLWRTYFIGGL